MGPCSQEREHQLLRVAPGQNACLHTEGGGGRHGWGPHSPGGMPRGAAGGRGRGEPAEPVLPAGARGSAGCCLREHSAFWSLVPYSEISRRCSLGSLQPPVKGSPEMRSRHEVIGAAPPSQHLPFCLGASESLPLTSPCPYRKGGGSRLQNPKCPLVAGHLLRLTPWRTSLPFLKILCVFTRVRLGCRFSPLPHVLFSPTVPNKNGY